MRSAHYFLIAIFLFLFAARLVQDGMFLDGVDYAAISNNLAHGQGTFWAPKFSDTLFPVFYEHPPLMFGIQALFFLLLGSGYGTERIYCALITVLTLWLITQVWRSFFRNTTLAQWWPLPPLIWMLNEDVYLSYTGNMLECTMTVFDLVAVLILLQKWPINGEIRSQRPAWIFIVAAGITLLAAFLTKGPAGLYPLAFFVAAKAAHNFSWAWVIRNSGAITLVVAALLGFLFIFDAPSTALTAYFQQQVVAALQGNRHENIAPHRLYMLQRFLETHAHWLAIGGLLWYFTIQRKRESRLAVAQKPMIMAAFLGAAALLPILLSPKQAPHYIIPALPWMALAIGAWYASITHAWRFSPRSEHIGVVIGMILVCTSAVWVMVKTGDTLPRSAAELGEVKQIMQVLPAGGTIGCASPELPYIMNAYMQRYNGTAIDISIEGHKYWLVNKNMPLADTVPVFFQIIPLETNIYSLYMRR